MWLKVRKELLAERIKRHLAVFHKINPMEPGGKTRDELTGLLNVHRNHAGEEVVRLLLKEMTQAGILKQVNNTWALVKHEIQLSQVDKGHIRLIKNFLKNCGMRTPLLSEMMKKATKTGIDEKRLREILRYLVGRKQAFFTDGHYLYCDVVNKCRLELLRYLTDSEESITVAQFRDVIDGNRKICLLLFSIFDSEGIVIRQKDLRYITNKGRRVLEESDER
ncbi:MAG: SelB C-terminal domain-containing protein [Candidatus Cloacimonetes bacterium]|nr:SelB C-terminal domain-containing protein [Candidatus Cloacimonadota bacterium]